MRRMSQQHLQRDRLEPTPEAVVARVKRNFMRALAEFRSPQREGQAALWNLVISFG